MADEAQTVRSVNWREVFPFTHIFRAFRIAMHPSKLGLGLLALLLLYTGGRILDGIWPASASPVYHEIDLYESMRWNRDPRTNFQAERAAKRADSQAAYAARLQQYHIIDDPDRAAQAARVGAYDEKLEQKIVQERNDQIAAAQQGRASLLNSPLSTDPAARRRLESDVNRQFDDAVRSYDGAALEALRGVQELRPRGVFAEFFDYEARQIRHTFQSVLSNNWLNGFSPDDRSVGVAQSVFNFVAVGPAWLVRYHFVYFLLFASLFLLIWAVFGGAIARIAAVHVARDEKISVRQALRFSIGKLLSFVFAPVIPLLLILVAGIVLAAGGALLYVPYIGPIVVSLLFILALVVGAVLTLVALGTVAGFNLMYPTIAVEGSDSFDAISRSFSYVPARPWRMLFYTAVAIAYGALTYLFVRYFIFITLAATHCFVGWWLTGQPARYWPQIWPPPSDYSLPYDINFAGLKWSEAAAAGIISFWVYLVIGLLGAYAISFYFTANTIIYFLMRREVDATELDEVYAEDPEDEFADAAPVTRADAGERPESPAPSAGATSAPGGGVTGTAGSSDPGGGSVRSYTAPSTDAPAGADSSGSAADESSTDPDRPADPGPATT